MRSIPQQDLATSAPDKTGKFGFYPARGESFPLASRLPPRDLVQGRFPAASAQGARLHHLAAYSRLCCLSPSPVGSPLRAPDSSPKGNRHHGAHAR